MNRMKKTIVFLLTLCMLVSALSGLSVGAYSTAKEVVYKIGTPVGSSYTNVVANWGTRGETATFLTTYADAYYTGSYTYETFSKLSGSTVQSSVPNSPLYSALSNMMNAKSKKVTAYKDNNTLMSYTDCVENDTAHISSFYSGTVLNSQWDSAATWNKEHTWPQSKISGSGANDVMMLRPTSIKENSERGNTAYGEGSGYYNPNSEANGKYNLHGDVARIVMYVYCRWGITSKMWGSSGVMESREVLLKWMEEDPVDTWELARNDSVQSITGVRNVFVDYPEVGFLMFGASIPDDYATPSHPLVTCTHNWTADAANTKAPTCTAAGVNAFVCTLCNSKKTEAGAPAKGHTSVPDAAIAATCTTAGKTAGSHCSVCNEILTAQTTVAALGHSWNAGEVTTAATETEKGVMTFTCTRCAETRTEEIPATGTQELPFTDTPRNAWYRGAVEFAYARELFAGTSATTFSPDGNMTRSMLVSVLWRLDNTPTPEAANPFTDVPAKEWYTDAVIWASENEIVSGIGGGRFDPKGNVSREQIASIMFRYAKYKNCDVSKTADLSVFPDAAKVSDWAKAALSWANAEGLITGAGVEGKTVLDPQGNASRAQVASILMRYVENIANAK